MPVTAAVQCGALQSGRGRGTRGMGAYDILPASLLARQALSIVTANCCDRESKQPFLLVKLRIRQADNQFCQEKLVLRCGTEKEFKVSFIITFLWLYACK